MSLSAIDQFQQSQSFKTTLLALIFNERKFSEKRPWLRWISSELISTKTLREIVNQTAWKYIIVNNNVIITICKIYILTEFLSHRSSKFDVGDESCWLNAICMCWWRQHKINGHCHPHHKILRPSSVKLGRFHLTKLIFLVKITVEKISWWYQYPYLLPVISVEHVWLPHF